jgi:HEAT repeat protein
MSAKLCARRLALVGAAGALAAAPLRTTRAQSLASRIEAIRDGSVQLTFASRPELCGDGDNVVRWGHVTHMLPGNMSWGHDNQWRECVHGPVSVTIGRSAGEIVSIRTRIADRPSRRDDVENLGVVSTREAARYFLGLVPALGDRNAQYALAAAVFADSVEIVPDLVRIVRNDNVRRDTRQSAVFWISSIDESSVSPTLRGLITDQGLDNEIRGAAIIALGREDISDDDIDFLRRFYPTASENLKDKIFLAVHSSDDPKVSRWLASVITNRDESMEVRKQALFWMGQGHGPLTDLTRLYEQLPDRQLHEQFTFVLSQRHEPGAVDKLIDIARNDPDRDIRRQAFFWLGQSKDERARNFLREVLVK